MKTKKENKEEYKLKKFRVGIFQIKNIETNRVFLKTTLNLDNAFNSDLFQLKSGLHANHQLQDDWKNLGAEKIEFQIFDELKMNDTDTTINIRKELNEFLKMHLNELKANGQLLY